MKKNPSKLKVYKKNEQEQNTFARSEENSIKTKTLQKKYEQEQNSFARFKEKPIKTKTLKSKQDKQCK